MSSKKSPHFAVRANFGWFNIPKCARNCVFSSSSVKRSSSSSAFSSSLASRASSTCSSSIASSPLVRYNSSPRKRASVMLFGFSSCISGWPIFFSGFCILSFTWFTRRIISASYGDTQTLPSFACCSSLASFSAFASFSSLSMAAFMLGIARGLLVMPNFGPSSIFSFLKGGGACLDWAPSPSGAWFVDSKRCDLALAKSSTPRSLNDLEASSDFSCFMVPGWIKLTLSSNDCNLTISCSALCLAKSCCSRSRLAASSCFFISLLFDFSSSNAFLNSFSASSALSKFLDIICCTFFWSSTTFINSKRVCIPSVLPYKAWCRQTLNIW